MLHPQKDAHTVPEHVGKNTWLYRDVFCHGASLRERFSAHALYANLKRI
jgi:hypothetical protein